MTPGPFFHGGYGGLRVGDLVLPPEQTGAATTADFGAEGVCRRDQVYVTTNELAARVFAAFHPSGRGKVYEVEPLGPVVDDEDATGDGYSFRTTRARVVRVLQLSAEERRRIITTMMEAR